MDEDQKHHIEIEGELVAELLDQVEYPSKIGNVAAISDKQIILLKRDRKELINYRFEFYDVADCRSIEYTRETAWYRVVLGAACFVGVGVLVYMMLANLDRFVETATPLIIGCVACISFGVRFVTSTHRHVLRFEMPEETLIWRSPAIDYDSKAEAAHNVRAYARQRGILKTR
jgi:hypothetical protein